MDDKNGYAVFFFPQALEALGEAIKPYLQEGKAGTHVVCREIDTGGALIEMTLDGRTTQGEPVQLELMVQTSMVRMIVSARSDEAFGFGPRIAVEAARPAADDGSKAQVEIEAAAASAAAPTKAPTPEGSPEVEPPAKKAKKSKGGKVRPKK